MSLPDVLESRRRRRASRRRTGWIGVDIGSSAIKIAQVKRIAGQFQIDRSLILRADPKCPFDAQSLEDGRVGREIREALTVHGGFEDRLAACTLSMENCELRTLSAAKGSKDEQRDMIRLELDCDAPPGSEPREFDFWEASTLDREDGNGMTQVYVLSLAQSLADSLAANLMRAGLKCQILDAVPFSLLRAVDLAGPTSGRPESSSEPVAIVDWGHSTATLVVIRDGQPALTRSLRDCGLKRLLETVGQRLRLETAESEALITTYGVRNGGRRAEDANELQSIITEIVGTAMRNLATELNETLSFLRMHFAELMPSKLLLTGGGATLPSVAEGLQSQINVPTAVWNLRGRSTRTEHPASILANAAALSALAWES